MKRYMQFRRQPRKLPVVLSVEDVADILAAAPGPGLKYQLRRQTLGDGCSRVGEHCDEW